MAHQHLPAQPAQTEADLKREDLIKIMKDKDEIEKSIMEITEYLTAPGMPGIKGNLVDEEGFPRADLNIIEIRKHRNRLACLQTDHQAIMKQIEQSLYSLHENHYKKEEVKEGLSLESLGLGTAKKQAKQTVDIEGGAGVSHQQELKIPFAWISDVIADSPAESAGLKLGDAIYQFGEVNHSNHENLQAIVNLVKTNLNFAITVKVLRKTLMGTSEDKELKFVPREWGGRGYLGCALKVNPI